MWWMAMLVGCIEDPAGQTCDGVDVDQDGVCDREAIDFSRDARIPAGEDRSNLFNLPADELAALRDEGLLHAMVWPVEISGMMLPHGALDRMLDPASSDPGIQAMVTTARAMLGWGSLEEMYDWVGLPPIPGPDGEGIYRSPLPAGMQAGDAMGVGVLDTAWGPALTFSCASCHASEFLGRTVVGLTNRRARANMFFQQGQQLFPGVDEAFFEAATDATEEEMALFRRAKSNLPAIGSTTPQVLGLDTSLAQVSLSLAKREADAWATRSAAFEANPRPNELETLVVDSKPAVWWTTRYKTKWLSDGSIVSGNPVFTNFLWNEIGRGTDMHELGQWLDDNGREVDALAAAIFATEAPRWTDFFSADTIDVAAAQRGEARFNTMCADCHGTYEKGWSADDAASRDTIGLIETTRVVYHEVTPVLDVGTDPQRAQGMGAFADGLNGLAISADWDTVVEVQAGYVPPPLDGIFTRFPYLHNNAVPTLCDLLRPAELRTPAFRTGPTDKAESFDAVCVGFPVGDATPAAWPDQPDSWFDTSQPGLRNTGHDAWLVGPDGEELMDDAARAELIMFLRTL